MKSRMPFVALAVLLFGLLALGCSGGSPSVDLGDQSTGNLLWGATHYMYEDRDLDKALAYADAGLELHGAEARSQQASLSDFPPTDPPEAAYEYTALNNVGLIALARGEILLAQGDRAAASEAFSVVIEDFGYAQAQDLGEWQGYAEAVPRDERGFIKIAEVAELRLAEIEAGRD